MENSRQKVKVILLIAVSIILLYTLYFAGSINVLVRAVLALAMLMAVGYAIQRILEFKGGYGFYMMGSKSGLSTISKISKKYKTFWEVMSIWGLTLGFGLLTYPLLKGKIDKRVYAFGVLSLVFIMIFVLPYLSLGFQFINLPQLQNAVSTRQQSPQYSIIGYATYGITVFAGFSGSIMLALFTNTESILYSIVQFLSNPALGAAASGITSQIPGVAPVIPGIDIPLIAGIIALAVLLIIHEFSHGIVARSAKVKLKSIGLLVFGFIPIGGYVEPDEKMVAKLNSTQQTNIFSAGIGANFLAMIVFFAMLFVLANYIVPYAYSYKVVVSGTIPNYPANGILQNGMQVLKWNNYTINNITTLQVAGSKDLPNQTVTILTDKGLYKFRAVADPSNSSRGIIGVSLGYSPIITTPYAKAVYFLYTVIGLSMLLNFLVAIVNLLPIPGFDGWRIYYANIKSKRFINFMGALIIIFLVINVLPWLFYL